VTTHDPRYTTPEWRRLRRLVLERDRGECQIRGTRCQGWATEVDHVVAVADGGDFWGPANLRASCAPCNRGRGADMTNARRWRYGDTSAAYRTRF